jgi:hypothetical protein
VITLVMRSSRRSRAGFGLVGKSIGIDLIDDLNKLNSRDDSFVKGVGAWLRTYFSDLILLFKRDDFVFCVELYKVIG